MTGRIPDQFIDSLAEGPSRVANCLANAREPSTAMTWSSTPLLGLGPGTRMEGLALAQYIREDG